VTRWRERAATACGASAGVALVAMMLLTVADIALRMVFAAPIRGSYELVELLLACTFFLALPAVFLRGEHIVVDLIDGVAPALVPTLKRLAGVIGIAILAVMGWQGVIAAGDTLVFGDVTADLGLPRILHWAALLIGIFGACLAVLAVMLQGRART
jgi:TRAP-type transport system small permease protein